MSAVRICAASDQSLLVSFHDEITIEGNRKVLGLLRRLADERHLAIRNLHPAYVSLLIRFDPVLARHADIESLVRALLASMTNGPPADAKLHEIPVCYDVDHGADLREVAEWHRMTPDRVVELHSSATYRVWFLGFVPGFAYLGPLPESLVTPRLPMPRRRVPPGSVGIAGAQTGIYPFATPGGWRLIGRTPLRMFRIDRERMSLLAPGDQVRFVPISSREFADREQMEREKFPRDSISKDTGTTGGAA